MPDYFSHAVFAQKVLEKCTKDVKTLIDNNTAYMLGAQGGDIFFAYKLNFKKTNLGRRLHRIDAVELFEELIKGNFSYAAGFATHYALDCTLHPFVYAYESGKKSPLTHMRFEKDLGLYLSRKFAIPRNILPRERILSQTFILYDSINAIEPKITVTGIERCLKRHFTYTRTLLKTKKQEFICDYDYRTLSSEVDNALSLASSCIPSLKNGIVAPELFSRSFLER